MTACTHLHLFCAWLVTILSYSLSKAVDRSVKELLWTYFDTCTADSQVTNLNLV